MVWSWYLNLLLSSRSSRTSKLKSLFEIFALQARSFSLKFSSVSQRCQKLEWDLCSLSTRSWWSSMRRDLSNWSCSRGELHKYWSAAHKNFKKFEIITEVKICKWSLPIKASGVPTKNEVEVHQICQEKLASGVKFPKPKHEVSSKSMRPWQWSEKNEVTGSRPLKWNTAVRPQRSWSSNLKFPEVFSKRRNQTTTKPNHNKTKPKQNQTKTKWSIPWLSTRSVLNTYGECSGKYVHTYVYVWSVKLHFLHTCSTKSDYSAKGIRDPKWHEMSLKYFLCDVLCHYIGRIRSTSHFLETTPEATSSWMKRNRSWTCCVFFEVPNLVAIDLPAVLSVWIRMFTFLERWDSRSNDLMNKLPDAPSPMA